MCEQILARPEWPTVQCEIAHIYGLNQGSARYVEGLVDNSCDNLILLCPNHHNLVDNLEPDNYPADVLLDWKHAHESVEAVGWEQDAAVVDEIVTKLARRLNLNLLAASDREPIRSDPERVRTTEQQLRQSSRSRQTYAYPPPRENPPKKIRISALGAELAMPAGEVVKLCRSLGVPVKSANSTLLEQYADMVRRRVERDRDVE